MNTILEAYLRYAAEHFGDIPRTPGRGKIAQFEKRHKICFQDQIKEFLLNSDGVGEENLNSVGQTLWKLEEFADLHEFYNEITENRYIIIGDEYYQARLFAFDTFEDSKIVSIVSNEGVVTVAAISNCHMFNEYVYNLSHNIYVD